MVSSHARIAGLVACQTCCERRVDEKLRNAELLYANACGRPDPQQVYRGCAARHTQRTGATREHSVCNRQAIRCLWEAVVALCELLRTAQDIKREHVDEAQYRRVRGLLCRGLRNGERARTRRDWSICTSV